MIYVIDYLFQKFTKKGEMKNVSKRHTRTIK